MSIPTADDVRTALARLDQATADDLETDHLDFKPWTDPKKDMRVAVEYAVCFANADGGAIVFGVADRVRGRTAAIHGARSYDLDVWRRGIFDGITFIQRINTVGGLPSTPGSVVDEITEVPYSTEYVFYRKE